MKKYLPLLALLAGLSLISGILLSKMSFIARTAISVFKKKYYFYAFMKVWWKAALYQFGALLLLLLLQILIQQKCSKVKAMFSHILCLIISVFGLYFTYHDFRHSISHRWAGERLHLGFYLFWIGWMCISLFLLWQLSLPTKDEDKKAASIE